VRIARIAPLAAALVFTAPAAASIWPPPQPLTLPASKVAHVRSPVQGHSCMAREARLKVARWLAPVACEQPPRSELLLVAPLFGGA
jgi:hypothetical protein